MRELTQEIEQKIEADAKALLQGQDAETIEAYIKAMKTAYKESIIEVV